MTDLSIQMKGKICKYCGQREGKHCLADVPYYAVSLFCGSFMEDKAEDRPRKTRNPSMKRIMNRTLVETF